MQYFRPKRKGLSTQLRKTRLFKYLTEKQVERIIERAQFVYYDESERIIEEATVDDSLYIVLQGTVSVRVQEQTQEVYICTIGPGDIFGEAGVFVNMQRTATVTANEPTRTMQLSRAQFMQSLNADPRSGIKILLMMVYSLLQKLRQANLELAFERREDLDQESVDAVIDELMPREARDVLE